MPDDGDSGNNNQTFFDPLARGQVSTPPDATPSVLSTEDVLKRGRELAQAGVPLQLSGLFEALAQLRARGAGSTASIFPAIVSQLGDLRNQYARASQALGRRLGVAGGGFAKRGKSQLLSQSGAQYGNLISQAQQQSFAGLLNTLARVQPFLGADARSPSVSTRPGQPTNPAVFGEAVANTARVADRLFSDSV